MNIRPWLVALAAGDFTQAHQLTAKDELRAKRRIMHTTSQVVGAKGEQRGY